MELITNLAASIPHLFNLLDVANTEVSELHPTLSVRLATESLFFQRSVFINNTMSVMGLI
ncbi:MAG: hypothetical protein ACL7AY_07915 [Candidatus Arsenophonus phytopathogenicus]